jgi:hypothetical protein
MANEHESVNSFWFTEFLPLGPPVRGHIETALSGPCVKIIVHPCIRGVLSAISILQAVSSPRLPIYCKNSVSFLYSYAGTVGDLISLSPYAGRDS